MSDQIREVIPLKYIDSKDYDMQNNCNGANKFDMATSTPTVEEHIASATQHEIVQQLLPKSAVAIESESENNEITAIQCDGNYCNNNSVVVVPMETNERGNDPLSDIKKQLNVIMPLSSPGLSLLTLRSKFDNRVNDTVTTRKYQAYTVNNEMQNEYSKNHLERPNVMMDVEEKLIDLDMTVEPESEEDDELKPLMTDNHHANNTFVDQQEFENISHMESNVYNQVQVDDSLPLHKEEKKDVISVNGDVESLVYDNRHQVYLSTVHSGKMSPVLNDVKFDENGILEIDTIEPCDIPNDRFSEDIVEQVEFYFSNESILKDAFLLKHVRRNKEGFVSLKLVSSFKRVRQLTKDWRIVGQAIRKKGRNIELNDICSKVRRIDPLPNFDETMPSRTIVACDLPLEKLTIEKVSDIFARCGEIALIRILKPGMTIPVDVRQFMNKYPEMQEKECALVEFTDSNAARNARNLIGEFQVYDMVAPKKKTGKKSNLPISKMVESYKFHENNYERSRGGSFSVMQHENDLRFKLRRNNSDFNVKGDQPSNIFHQPQHTYSVHNHHGQQQIYQPPPYGTSQSRSNSFSNNNEHYNNNNHFHHYSPSSRRYSNSSMNSVDIYDSSRRYSGCSEGYSSCGEYSRRPSASSNSDGSRRNSGCSDQCPCSRRVSQCSDLFRRISQNTDFNNRRLSNGQSCHLERNFSNQNESVLARRMSIESDYGRKLSTGSASSITNTSGGFYDNNNYQHYRKFSNEYNPVRKYSNSDQTFMGRRISTDSGYDRKFSLGSDGEFGSPRSRTNSLLICQNKSTEAVVRSPIGPDGSKGFVARSRKFGQTVPPVN